MDLLNEILNNKEYKSIIETELRKLNQNAIKVDILGFDNYKPSNIFKGFIPFDTKIKYGNFNVETYSMNTTDFFYDFALYIKKYNIVNKNLIVYNLLYFLIEYFGYKKNISRESIFHDAAWRETKTDEEFFERLENNTIGDLKGSGAAECSEYSAVAEQILSLFNIETYYCVGGINNIGHCFNITKINNGYAIIDYSMPIKAYDENKNFKCFYPFVGKLTEEEFNNFVINNELKIFNEYIYINNKKVNLDIHRSYYLGVDYTNIKNTF